ncbi:cytochrome c oxidase subunit III [Kalymmatonema gypsitolerans NIES-4073]|uniref:cytochrome c oxidase subunit 3 n=1 Tax=Scytonema sp. HK-05 TaxID=1137095 RepID=UPI000937AC61|nr:heme-copper oxidase subunit III [Scytonema sp. HK-05]OKH58053.1 heme-copper oxidase subunit III [Scytonema sp. HK-05]BAY47572.1 cytochrome c oxidase subunit III [Scytonema sp. HK-05]BAZ23507.1 cytochrome c oxidase subunit III [Scytonema sp. NIES-4073]
MENPIDLLEEILDESPIRLDKLRRSLPNWLQRFLPIGGGNAEDEHGRTLFGFTVFLLSESIVFLSFFFTYIALRLTTSNWLPPGVSGPELSAFTIFNTVVLLSSSFVIQSAENALKRRKITRFRLLWLITSVMGIYFLIGQAIEWNNLNFGLTTGLVGGTFYVLTGFHGLHVLVGVLLQILMLIRSFIRGNYNKGHFGVSATTLFWHFVDVIWVILFSLLYLWQP